MEQSTFSNLIQSINQLNQSQSENEFYNRMQVQNYFSLPFALSYGMTPTLPSSDKSQLKNHFRIDNNNGILEMFLSNILKMAILPDVKTHFDFDNRTLLLVVDITNKQVIFYLPRVNNYTKFAIIDCNDLEKAKKGFKLINDAIETIRETNDDSNAQIQKGFAFQLTAESKASENYSQTNQNFEFCKLLIEEMNVLVQGKDERFIDFISNVIAQDTSLGDNSINKIKAIINKALENQSNNFNYRFVAGSTLDIDNLMKKLPNTQSPATLKPIKHTIGYVDTDRQLEAPKSTEKTSFEDLTNDNTVIEEQDNNTKIINADVKEEKQKSKNSIADIFANFNNDNKSLNENNSDEEEDLNHGSFFD